MTSAVPRLCCDAAGVYFEPNPIPAQVAEAPVTQPAIEFLHPAQLLLLTPAQMGAADAYAVEHGTLGMTLMDNAGRAVADAIVARWAPCPVAVLCGPGNNGGDGFVVARLLAEAGWPVRVALLGARENLTGDAAHHAALWDDAAVALTPTCLDGAELVVDALFGAGLNRPVGGAAAEVLAAVKVPVVAVDVPSGVDGDTGRVRGRAIPAALTVTFFRKKPGHLLLPGRDLCGEVVVAEIGIPAAAALAVGARTWRNAPGLWRLPRLEAQSHKYTRGHVLAVGGPMTGATRLAVRAARRAGAGLASVYCAPADAALYAADAPGVIVLSGEGGEDAGFLAALDDPRRNAVVIGPGHGEPSLLRRRVDAVLALGRACVLDADVFGAFAEAPSRLFDAVQGPAILTPHTGEFARLFPDLDAKADRLGAARAAAARARAVVVLKGSDTVIAAPDGRAAINANAPPWLATGGAGDVLAGFAAGLLAQGMAAFEAACAAVWLHGAAAQSFGPGLIAEDLPEALPKVLAALAVKAR